MNGFRELRSDWRAVRNEWRDIRREQGRPPRGITFEKLNRHNDANHRFRQRDLGRHTRQNGHVVDRWVTDLPGRAPRGWSYQDRDFDSWNRWQARR